MRSEKILRTNFFPRRWESIRILDLRLRGGKRDGTGGKREMLDPRLHGGKREREKERGMLDPHLRGEKRNTWGKKKALDTSRHGGTGERFVFRMKKRSLRSK